MMAIRTHTRPEYDLPTAVTFLLAGIALGTLLAFIFSPLAVDTKIARRSKKQRPFSLSVKPGEPVLYE
jgi:hypothetical protein